MLALLKRAWFYQAIIAWRLLIGRLLFAFHDKKRNWLGRALMWLVLFPLLHTINGIGLLVIVALFGILAPIDLCRLLLLWIHDERRIQVTGE